MSGILKVDQIQLRDGSTPSAADLGLNVAGGVLQVKTVKKTIGNTGMDADITDLTISTTGSYGTAYQLLNIDFTPKSANSIILVRFTGMIRNNISGAGGINFFFGKDGSNLLTSGGNVDSVIFEYDNTALSDHYRSLAADWSFTSGQTTQMSIDARINNYNGASSIYLSHDGSLHLTVMEIAQ